jgi:hypothetical protein
MSEESDNLNEKLDKILSKLPKENLSKTKILEVLEKLLIPVLLGILAFITNRAGNQISEAQLELSRSQLKLAEAQNARQESEARSNLQTKYIELFYKEISSQDAKKQEYALSFLKLISPDVAAPLLGWATIYVKPEVQPQVNTARNEINSRILSSYEIVLYFPENNQDSLKSAQDIKRSLLEYGLGENQVKLEKKDDTFFQRLGYPKGYEIRYDKGSEEDAAQLLESILKRAYPSKQFVKLGIGSGTMNSISIFFTQ